MTALLLATMVLGATADTTMVDKTTAQLRLNHEAELLSSAEFQQMHKVLMDIARHIKAHKMLETSDWLTFENEEPKTKDMLKDSNLKFVGVLQDKVEEEASLRKIKEDEEEEARKIAEDAAYEAAEEQKQHDGVSLLEQYVPHDGVDEDIFEHFDEATEDRIIERVPGLKANPPKGHHLHKKRICKMFDTVRFTIHEHDKLAYVYGDSFESCLASCEANLLCSQVVFEKNTKKCTGHRKAMAKTMDGGENWASGHCATEKEESLNATTFSFRRQHKPQESEEDIELHRTESDDMELRRVDEQGKDFNTHRAEVDMELRRTDESEEDLTLRRTDESEEDLTLRRTDDQPDLNLLRKDASDINLRRTDHSDPGSVLQTHAAVDAATDEFEQQMKMEEQLAEAEKEIDAMKMDKQLAEEEKRIAREEQFAAAYEAKHPSEEKRIAEEEMLVVGRAGRTTAHAATRTARASPGALVQAKTEDPKVKKLDVGLAMRVLTNKKKCMTFETSNLMKKGSLLQVGGWKMGKTLVAAVTTGDWLTCLQKCQQDKSCKQVVYDKQASQCYKHEHIEVQKSNTQGRSKYIAATCTDHHGVVV